MSGSRELVFFDFETAGLLEHQPNIQLAAIAVDSSFNAVEEFQEKLQFDVRKADPEALRINHYDEAIWEKEALPEAVALKAFAQFLSRHASVEMTSKRTGNPYRVARLAGHNATTFDGPRLQAAFKRHEMFLPAHPQVLCTLSRSLWYCIEQNIGLPSLKLEALAAHFGVKTEGSAHDALQDCWLSIGVAKAIATKYAVPSMDW